MRLICKKSFRFKNISNYRVAIETPLKNTKHTQYT